MGCILAFYDSNCFRNKFFFVFSLGKTVILFLCNNYITFTPIKDMNIYFNEWMNSLMSAIESAEVYYCLRSPQLLFNPRLWWKPCQRAGNHQCALPVWWSGLWDELVKRSNQKMERQQMAKERSCQSNSLHPLLFSRLPRRSKVWMDAGGTRAQASAAILDKCSCQSLIENWDLHAGPVKSSFIFCFFSTFTQYSGHFSFDLTNSPPLQWISSLNVILIIITSSFLIHASS